MHDRRFELLKAALFEWGSDYIEEFLGYEYPRGEEKDVTESRMDEVYEQMPECELEEFYQKFCIK